MRPYHDDILEGVAEVLEAKGRNYLTLPLPMAEVLEARGRYHMDSSYVELTLEQTIVCRQNPEFKKPWTAPTIEDSGKKSPGRLQKRRILEKKALDGSKSAGFWKKKPSMALKVQDSGKKSPRRLQKLVVLEKK